MSGRDTLTPELRAEVLRLEDDLRKRVNDLPDVQQQWRSEYDAARAAERTAATWQQWSDERITLAAVAWVLTTVFIRFCEDNALVKPVWISGPRSREALDAQQHFLIETARTNPDVTDREWLLEAVNYLKSLPATGGLVDEDSPMWLVSPSGDAASRLLAYWRERGEDGALLRDLTDPKLDTRFLGDLYQDISEDAKKRYALLQTPVFVEEFILDRTLEPALNERPLEGFKMIDPTCGSGHFLLGGFQRLLDRWHKKAPAMDERERVQAALDSVYGVDLNPFAVAIARFRLTVAALQASGLNNLEDAPAFKYHLAAGDSLLHGLDQEEFDYGAEFSPDRVAANFAYATENLHALRTILRNGQYDAVVGNPPYITVKDAALNQLYRKNYATAHRQYALTVPFMERFYLLAKPGDSAGWTGQITSNSFMKREFGSKLIEKFLPTKDLRLVADTSGAYIPGHGTPTVILVGRNRRPQTSATRAVLGVRGEPGRPVNPARGKVWSSIRSHVDEPGWDDEWVSVVELDRTRLAGHPWSLTGGGADDLLNAIDSAPRTLSDVARDFGVGAVTREDSAYLYGRRDLERRGVSGQFIKPLIEGTFVRDYSSHNAATHCVWPYAEDTLTATKDEYVVRLLWPARTVLSGRVAFGKTQTERGLAWYEFSMFFRERYKRPLTIAYPLVSTHNHFILDRSPAVFHHSAPVIQLRDEASEEQHLELLAALNSSTACFWLKQNSHDKGNGGIGGGIADQEWERFYEYTSTTMKDFPLPATLPLERGRRLDSLATQMSAKAPAAVMGRDTPSRAAFDAARVAFDSLRAQLIAEQEELDWEVYQRYGLIDGHLTYAGAGLPELALGERAFEIVLARRAASGAEETAWFERHDSKPITEIPADWPAAYRDLVHRRIELIESNPFIRLLEKPEYKRRWASESWEKQEERALRLWLLDRLEDRRYWFDQGGRPTPISVAVLADAVSRDPELTGVLSLWEGRFDVPVATSLEKLLAPEAVPYLAAYRYKESGLRKRAAWEATWELQRREDAGTYDPRPKEHGGDGPIPVPPKYTTADFAKTEYWSHRGKLDVPKERFILYPDAGREGDLTPVLGWAGWDHAQQALALGNLLIEGEQQGWPDKRLLPLVAGLAEVLPWVQQWHSDYDPAFGGSPAEFLGATLDTYMAKLGATRETLRDWRPPAPTRGRKRKV
jgi:hypothetical protein